jgi:hypothetical protein
LLPSYWCSNALIGGALIAAISILPPATILHAQQGSPDATPAPPGISWERPPAEGEWEPITQGGAKEDGAQDQSDAGKQHGEAERHQEQDLMAQQAMAEQARRMADLTFWLMIIGAAALIGLGITIYYSRQTARAAVSAVDLIKQASLTEHRARVQVHPVGTQRAEAAQLNQQGKVKL